MKKHGEIHFQRSKIPRSQDGSIGLFIKSSMESGYFCQNWRNGHRACSGWQREKFAELAKSLVRLNGRMRHAHAMSSIGLIFGFSGIKMG